MVGLVAPLLQQVNTPSQGCVGLNPSRQRHNVRGHAPYDSVLQYATSLWMIQPAKRGGGNPHLRFCIDWITLQVVPSGETFGCCNLGLGLS